MSDEQLADIPAPEQEATAAPESEVIAPEAEQQAEAPKTFTQEELDAIVSKRLAREQRKWLREQSQRQSVPTPANVPPADTFDSVEAYAQALATQKAEELIQQREQQRQQSELADAYHEREEEARGKYDDFEQVAYNPNLPITNVMAETIQASDIGPELAYHLGSNPKEAERISRLSPYLQAKEIGKLEARLASDPPVKKTTAAPEPIAPVTPRGSNAPVFDTTDPRSVKSMSTSEWIARERERQIKKLEAQRLR